MKSRNLVILLLISSAILLAAGLTVPVSLGDEIHHFRFAKESFAAGGRGVFESIYGSSREPGFFFETEALWPLGLAALWRVTGGISFPVAQLYHHLFYLLLIVSTFGLARKMYGEKEAFWSALLAASAPMAVSFGILFYLDVPATALCTLTLWLLAGNRCLAAGIALGLQFLMKKSTLFFAPVYALWILIRDWRKPFRCLLNWAFLFAPALLMAWWDQSWRQKHLVNVILTPKWLQSRLNDIANANKPPVERPPEVPDFLFKITDYANSSFLNPLDVAKYFGAALLAGLFLYIVTRKFEKKDGLFIALITIFSGAAYFLRLFPDIRYLMPVTPLLAILAGKTIARLNRPRILKAFLIGACILQIAAAAAFTHRERGIPPAVQEAFAHIRETTPKDAMFLYPETNIMEYAQRKMVWGRIGLAYLFWGSEAQKKEQIRSAQIDYIAVKKNRIYEDRGLSKLHFGKYPASFLDSLKTYSWVRKVFENDLVVIYQIDRRAL